MQLQSLAIENVSWNQWLYIGVSAVVFVVYLILFIRRRRAYQLTLALFAASTWLAYFLKGRTQLMVLGLVETGLFVLLIYFLFHRKRTGGLKEMLRELDQDAAPDAPEKPADSEKKEE